MPSEDCAGYGTGTVAGEAAFGWMVGGGGEALCGGDKWRACEAGGAAVQRS